MGHRTSGKARTLARMGGHFMTRLVQTEPFGDKKCIGGRRIWTNCLRSTDHPACPPVFHQHSVLTPPPVKVVQKKSSTHLPLLRVPQPQLALEFPSPFAPFEALAPSHLPPAVQLPPSTLCTLFRTSGEPCDNSSTGCSNAVTDQGKRDQEIGRL